MTTTTEAPKRNVTTPEERAAILRRVKAMTPEQRQRILELSAPRMVEPYIAHIPHPKQQVFLGMKNLEAMYGGAAGGGKALALDTPLPTPNGWTTMAQVQPGDALYDEAGCVVTVLAVSEVMYNHDVYEVTFSDGSTILADAGHMWSVESPQARCNHNPDRGSIRPPSLANLHSASKSWQDNTLTTVQVAQNVRTGANGRLTYSVPVSEPLKGLRRSLAVDPYVFGLWLGDGDTRRGYVTIGQDDIELVQHVKAAGYDVTQLGYDDTHYRVEGLSEDLRRAGVLGPHVNPRPKCIPLNYLRASIEQRAGLLQGIVDSDGHVDGDVEVCWTNKGLVDDLLELLASLGIKAVAKESRAVLNGKDCGPRWRVKFMTDRPAARLTRKLDAQKRTGFRGTHCRRYITDVVKVPSVPVKCVKVDGPSRLYLAGRSMIPTHNSDALLMAAMQYVDVPGYSALILRRTWPDLNAPGAILDRANVWLSNTPAHKRDGGRVWEFPTVDEDGREAQPARVSFGYLQYDKDRYKFQSAEYQFVGFDELTQFTESQYTYLFSRIRRPQLVCLTCGTAVRRYESGWKHTTREGWNCSYLFPDPKVLLQYPPTASGLNIFDVPLRMRSATNPGGVGHEWVRARFVEPVTKEKGAVFVPALLQDNPSLDQETYRENLQHLTITDQERLLNGDWDVVEAGDMFKRHWFKSLQVVPRTREVVRFWDGAATAGGGDWTVGALVRLDDGKWIIEDILRGQWSSHQKETIIRQTAAADGVEVAVRMEQEPGSSGVDVIDGYRRHVLLGYDFDGIRSTGSKEDRAYAMSASAEAGNFYLIAGAWNKTFLDEAEMFPFGANDDQVDAVAGAVNFLSLRRRARLIT